MPSLFAHSFTLFFTINPFLRLILLIQLSFSLLNGINNISSLEICFSNISADN